MQRNSLVQDVDHFIHSMILIEFWEKRISPKMFFLAFQVQVEQGVNEIVDRALEWRRRNIYIAKDLEDVGNRRIERHGSMRVKVGDVEQQLEGFGQRKFVDLG